MWSIRQAGSACTQLDGERRCSRCHLSHETACCLDRQAGTPAVPAGSSADAGCETYAARIVGRNLSETAGERPPYVGHISIVTCWCASTTTDWRIGVTHAAIV